MEAGKARLAKAVGVARVPAPVPSYRCYTAGSNTGRVPARTAVHFTVNSTLFRCHQCLHHRNVGQCCKVTRKCMVGNPTPRGSPHKLSEPREPTPMA